MATKMSRTLITLSASEMRWLKKASLLRGTSMASLVREAIIEYRVHAETSGLSSSLAKTAGLWKNRNSDGLAYVDRLRDEWDR